MVIIYDCQLTEPPSSIYCFRDVTLFSEIYLNADNVLKCPKGTRTAYWNWIKNFGAHDFVSDLIKEDEDQLGITVGFEKSNIIVDRLDEFNYGIVINFLKKYFNHEF
mgnify:CR=1 FL=1